MISYRLEDFVPIALALGGLRGWSAAGGDSVAARFPARSFPARSFPARSFPARSFPARSFPARSF
ncbi:MAG: hypothetical protein ACK57U_12775, partial [Planctomycetota bacterium]